MIPSAHPDPCLCFECVLAQFGEPEAYVPEPDDSEKLIAVLLDESEPE